MDDTVQSPYSCGKDIDILKDFTYHGSAVQNSEGSSYKFFRRN